MNRTAASEWDLIFSVGRETFKMAAQKVSRLLNQPSPRQRATAKSLGWSAAEPQEPLPQLFEPAERPIVEPSGITFRNRNRCRPLHGLALCPDSQPGVSLRCAPPQALCHRPLPRAPTRFHRWRFAQSLIATFCAEPLTIKWRAGMASMR
jgi:hypothetical protein